MATIAIVLPRQTAEKHAGNPLAKVQRFLSFGALAMATHAHRNGHQVAIVDDHAMPVGSDVVSQIRATFGAKGPDVIGLACVSAYCASRTRELLNDMAVQYPESLRVVGGQHFAGLWQDQYRRYLPTVQALVSGEGEAALRRILDLISARRMPEQWRQDDLPDNVWWSLASGAVARGSSAASVVPLDDVAVPEYGLYPSINQLFPSVEFSRGCRHDCAFCVNTSANRHHFRRVSFTCLRRVIDALARHFDNRPLNFYMQASDFLVNEQEAMQMSHALRDLPFEFAWRAEIRADEMSPKCMGTLRKCGLAYVDLGLDSASGSMLTLMKKTTNPSRYLSRASDLLAAARDCGVFVKVNYLIHPGDTLDTVAESREWLLRHRHIISAISSGVTIEYPGTLLSRRLYEYAAKFGTRRRKHELSEWGLHNLDPSTELTYEAATDLTVCIAQQMQSREAFAISKAFGYLPVGWDAARVLAELPPPSDTTPYH